MPTTAPMSTNVAQTPNYNMSTNAGPVVATQPKAVVAPDVKSSVGLTPSQINDYYTSQQNSANPMSPAAYADSLKKPALIVTGNQATKQFNDQKATVDNIIANLNANKDAASGKTSDTGGATSSGGTTSGDQTKTGTDANGTTGSTDTNDFYQKMKDQATASNAKALADAKVSLEATKANVDAQTASLIDSINASFDIKVKEQTNANAMMEGISRKQGFMGGAVMANAGTQDRALSDTVQAGVDKISALNSQRQQLIVQAQQAQQDKNVNMSDIYTKALQDADKNLQDTILNVSKQADTEKQQAIENARKAEADVRTQQDQEIKMAETSAPLLYNAIQGLNGKDAQAMIEKYSKAKGIDPDLLSSSLVKYDQSSQSKELSLQQKQLAIEKAQVALDKSRAGADIKASDIDNAVASAVIGVQKIVKNNKWKGINPDDNAVIESKLQAQYGANSVIKYREALTKEGLSVDNG